MSHFLRDIVRQPAELQRALERWNGAGRGELEAATAAVRGARHVYLTGIGSSWHAALNVAAQFHGGGRPVYLLDAAELVSHATLPRESALIVISRSGRSVEIVQLLEKARASGAAVIGVTNAPEGTLAREAQFPLVYATEMDHAISVVTYTTLALTAGLLASAVLGLPNGKLASELSRAIAEAEKAIAGWQKQLETTPWLAPGAATYFLARGSSLGSAYEARLLWEEGVKSPATAMGTGSFRHGPQEMVREGMRFGMWMDGAKMREADLAVARDLEKLGASVMLIGQRIPRDAGGLVFELPAIPAEWQFVIDMIPAQLAAERLAQLSGVDCDTFRLCSFIVEDEAGLLHGESGKR
jgi:glucosamine--fructose-6-phosphate aminotransferase (isomerizing)